MAYPPGVFQNYQYDPTPDSTPSNVTVVETLVGDATWQEQRGTCFIINRRKFLDGGARIRTSGNATRTVVNVGTVRVRNPLQFIPAFMKQPLDTNTEMTIEFQKGKVRIRVAGIAKTQFGVSNFSIGSGFDGGAFQGGAFQ